jgi:hypothetical protein
MTLRTRLLLSAALGLGLCLGSVSLSRAADKYGPPRYYPVPGPAPCPTPVYPVTPAPTTPPTTPPGTTPTEPQRQPDQAQPPMDLSGLDVASVSAPTGGTTGGTGMNGRADQNNRLNLFDSQAAIPQNRVWVSVQRVMDYKTGLEPAPSPSSLSFSSISSALSDGGLNANIIQRQEETLYRVGAELKLGCNASIAVQGQYLSFDGDDSGGSDTFTNPQILLKYVLSNCNGRVVSATLGYQPDIDTGRLEFNDNTHALYPGMLFYDEVSCRCFAQGGFQFRVPLEDNNVYTFDYAVSFGYWLWRHPSCDGNWYGDCGHGGCHGHRPLIIGLVPQIEFFGKEVIGDATITNPFGLDPLPFFDSSTGTTTFFNPFVYEEPRHVYDVTVGAKLMLANNSYIAAAVSYPLTGDSVRQSEYFVTLNWGF